MIKRSSQSVRWLVCITLTFSAVVLSMVPAVAASAGTAASTSASLHVAITDLPKATAGLVVVNGPRGFKRKLTRTASLTGMIPGTYQVVAQPVKGPHGTTYVPTVTGADQKLAAGKKGTATAAYYTQIPSTTKPVAGKNVTTVSGSGATKKMVIKGGSKLVVGDVIAAGTGPHTPDGLLAKVTKVTHNGSTQTVTTTSVTLQQAIPQGDLSFSTTLPPESPSLPAAKPNVRRAPGTPPSFLKNLSCGAKGSIGVSGSLEDSLVPSLKAHWQGKNTSITVTATATLSADLKAAVSASASCELSPVALGKPIVLGAFTVWVDFVPVVIVPELQFAVEGSASVKAAISTEAHHKVSANAGLSLANGRLSPVHSLTDDSGFTPPTLTDGGKVELSVSAGLTMALYGVGGAAISLDPGLALNADTNADPWWTLDGTLDGDGSLKIPVLGVSTRTVPLFSRITHRLAQAPGRFRAGTVLVYGDGDGGNTTPDDQLNSVLTQAGYHVTEASTLPADLSSYSSIWHVGIDPISAADGTALVAFAKKGGGLYLTGERPCCEDLNASDATVVNNLVGGAGIGVGGLGDVCSCATMLPVNPDVIDGVATKPFALTGWQPDAPGGLSNVKPANVLTYDDNGDGTTTPTGAVWDNRDIPGGGRLAILMDINWIEPGEGDPTTSAQMAQNLALFLGRAAAVPAAPIPAPAGKIAPRTGPQRSSTAVRTASSPAPKS